MTALREANQVGALQPTTLVAYEADIGELFDGRDAVALAADGMDAAALSASTWRDEMKSGGQAKTQDFAQRLIASGRHGLLVRSFAAGSTADDLNLVLWRWGDAAARLALIDGEGRLSP
jgi:RES domain-containing protein